MLDFIEHKLLLTFISHTGINLYPECLVMLCQKAMV